jgi:hypothetical protein
MDLVNGRQRPHDPTAVFTCPHAQADNDLRSI